MICGKGDSYTGECGHGERFFTVYENIKSAVNQRLSRYS